MTCFADIDVNDVESRRKGNDTPSFSVSSHIGCSVFLLTGTRKGIWPISNSLSAKSGGGQTSLPGMWQCVCGIHVKIPPFHWHDILSLTHWLLWTHWDELKGRGSHTIIWGNIARLQEKQAFTHCSERSSQASHNLQASLYLEVHSPTATAEFQALYCLTSVTWHYLAVPQQQCPYATHTTIMYVTQLDLTADEKRNICRADLQTQSADLRKTPRISRHFRFCCIQTNGENDKIDDYHVIETEQWRCSLQIRPAPPFVVSLSNCIYIVKYYKIMCILLLLLLLSAVTPSCASAEAYKLAQCTRPQGWGS